MANAIKDASRVFFGQSSSFVIRFITSIFVARWLGAEGKGLYASLIMIPNMMVTLGELGTRQSIIYYLGRKIYSLNSIVNTAIILIISLALPLTIFCLLIYYYYYFGLFPLLSQIIAILIIPITLLVKVMSGVFLGLNKVGIYSKVTWIPATIELVMSFFLVYYFKLGLIGAVASLVSGSLFTIFYGLSIVNKDVKFGFKYFQFPVAKAIVTKGVLFALALFIIQLNYRVDVFLLKSMVPMDDIGVYSVGVSLSEILWQIPSAIAVVILARTATSNSDSQKFKVAQSLRVSLVSMILIAIISIIILNYLIPIIYGEDFSRSIVVNRILMIGTVIFTFYKILNSRIAGQGRPLITLVLFIPCLIVKILMNLWLVPIYGINGAAWSSNISYLLASIFILIAFCHLEHITVNEVFHFKKGDFDFILNKIKH